MAQAFRIPGSSLDAPAAKDLEAARRSYLFLTDVTEASADRAIATSLRAADPVSDWPGGAAQRTYEGREADHCDLVVGEEIIRHERAGHPPDPRVFSGLVRGAYGTRASAHPAGTPILHPKIDGCIPGYVVDQDSSILEEMAERVAGLIDHCRFDMVYFDGGEDVPPPIWHYATKFQLAVLERTRRRPIIHQGTILTHFLWHSFARTNTVDIRTVGVKEHIDASLRGLEICRPNLLPGELGWFGLWPPSGSNPGLQLDEIEYLLSRSLAWDAPISIETSLANIEAHSLSPARSSISCASTSA